MKKPTASNIVIDIMRHEATMAYVTCVADCDTIVFCNNKRWWDDDQFEEAIGVVSHETIHLLCLQIAREDDMSVGERNKMWFGIDNPFKKLNGKTMNSGTYVAHGMYNVDKYLK